MNEIKSVNKSTNRIGAKIAIIIEIILILSSLWCYKEWNAECYYGWDCLGKIIPYLLIRITIPVAIINLFIIQILRKKSIIFPSIVVLCILIGLGINNYQKHIYTTVTRFEPENSFDSIFNNDSLKSNKYISYFVHNDYLYYYKYDANNINFEEDEKGILFKTDFNLNKTEKVCELNRGADFYFDFIYDNEVFYTTREKDDYSYHNALKRLNLDTCEEKNIIDYDGTTSGEWKYILNSRNKDKILFYDFGKDFADDMVYLYNIKENLIVKSGVMQDAFEYFSINDYINFNTYSVKGDGGIYLNNELIYKINELEFEDTNIDILDYDDENIYLYNSNNIYVINKKEKNLIQKKELPLKNIYHYNVFMDHYFQTKNETYKYNITNDEFLLLEDFPKFNYKDDEYRNLNNIYKINNYYLFSDDDFINGTTEYDDNTKNVALLIFDNNGKNILKEYCNGNLINYFIDNDDIYLIYSDNTIKKIETKTD